MLRSIDRLTQVAPVGLIILTSVFFGLRSSAAEKQAYDIVVYGDSSGAVVAAIAAKRMGCKVVLVSPAKFLGGMSSSGLGATDFLGRRATFGGIASEFYDAIAVQYRKKYVPSFNFFILLD